MAEVAVANESPKATVRLPGVSSATASRSSRPAAAGEEEDGSGSRPEFVTPSTSGDSSSLLSTTGSPRQPQPHPSQGGSRSSSRSPRPLAYLYGDSRATSRRPVWDSPRPVRPGGPGGKYTGTGSVGSSVDQRELADVQAYCTDLERAVEQLRGENATLAAAQQHSAGGGGSNAQSLAGQVTLLEGRIAQQARDLATSNHSNDSLGRANAKMGTENKRLAHDLAHVQKRLRGTEAAAQVEVEGGKAFVASATDEKRRLERSLGAREKELAHQREELARAQQLCRTLDDHIVEMKLVKAEGVAALALERASRSKDARNMKEVFASSQAVLNESFAVAQDRLQQSMSECKELAAHLRQAGLEKMSLQRQFVGLQARSQVALDTAYQETAEQRERARGGLERLEAENDAVWGHLEALERAVFADPQVFSRKGENQELHATHVQLLQGRKDREKHARHCEELVLKLRCENEMLQGRVQVAEGEFLNLARSRGWDPTPGSRGGGGGGGGSSNYTASTATKKHSPKGSRGRPGRKARGGQPRPPGGGGKQQPLPWDSSDIGRAAAGNGNSSAKSSPDGRSNKESATELVVDTSVVEGVAGMADVTDVAGGVVEGVVEGVAEGAAEGVADLAGGEVAALDMGGMVLTGERTGGEETVMKVLELEATIKAHEDAAATSRKAANRTNSRLSAVKAEFDSRLDRIKKRVGVLCQAAALDFDPNMDVEVMLEDAITSNGLGMKPHDVDSPSRPQQPKHQQASAPPADQAAAAAAAAPATLLSCGRKIGKYYFSVVVLRDEKRHGYLFDATEQCSLNKCDVFVSDHYCSYLLRESPELLDTANPNSMLEKLVERLQLVSKDGAADLELALETAVAPYAGSPAGTVRSLGGSPVGSTGSLGDSPKALVRTLPGSSPVGMVRTLGGAANPPAADKEAPGAIKAPIATRTAPVVAPKDATAAGTDKKDDEEEDEAALKFMAGRSKRRGSILNPAKTPTLEPRKLPEKADIEDVEEEEGGPSSSSAAAAVAAESEQAAESPEMAVATPLSRKTMKFLQTITRQDTFSKGMLPGADAPPNPLLLPVPSRADAAPPKSKAGEEDFSVPRPRKRRGEKKEKKKRGGKSGSKSGSDDEGGKEKKRPQRKASYQSLTGMLPRTDSDEGEIQVKKPRLKMGASNKDTELAEKLGIGTQADELAKLKRGYVSNPFEEDNNGKDGESKAKKAQGLMGLNCEPIQRQDTFGQAEKQSPTSMQAMRDRHKAGPAKSRFSGNGGGSNGKQAAEEAPTRPTATAAPTTTAEPKAKKPVPRQMSLQDAGRKDTLGKIEKLQRPKLPAGLRSKLNQDPKKSPKSPKSPAPPAAKPSSSPKKSPQKIAGLRQAPQRQDTFGAINKMVRPRLPTEVKSRESSKKVPVVAKASSNRLPANHRVPVQSVIRRDTFGVKIEEPTQSPKAKTSTLSGKDRGGSKKEATTQPATAPEASTGPEPGVAPAAKAIPRGLVSANKVERQDTFGSIQNLTGRGKKKKPLPPHLRKG